jgi:protein-tyrosine-phosphatase
MQSDRAVKELVGLVQEPQNLVSYHLRLLRDGGLVRAHRSSADGRDSYHSIDLDACREALQATGRALHPAFGLWSAVSSGPPVDGPTRRPRVLFLCTGNSARSQMAEALLARMSHGTIETASAGSHPKPLHPNAVRVLQDRGLDISSHRSKHVDEVVDQWFDTIITLCDRVREVCPEFGSRPDRAHWSVADPSLDGSTDRETLPAFERTVTELETRIRFRFHPLVNEAPKRRPRHVKR